MVLPKQEVVVPFTGGIDTKISDYLLSPGNFLTLENMVQNKTGELEKRTGYTALGTTITGTANTISSAKQLLRFKDELLLADGYNLYSYNSVSDTWSNRGTYFPMQVSSSKIMGGAYSSRPAIDTMLSNNIYAHIYRIGSGYTSLDTDKYYLTTQNATDYTILTSDYKLGDASASMWVKASALGQYGLVLYASDTKDGYLDGYVLDMQDDGSVSSVLTVATDAVSSAGSRYFATCEVDSTKCLVAYQTSGSKIKIGYCDETGMLDTVYSLNLNEEPWALARDGNGFTYLFTRSTSTTLKCTVLYDEDATSLNAVGASTTIDTTSNTITAITACRLTDTSVQVFYEEYNGSASRLDRTKVKTAVVDYTATVTTAAKNLFLSVGIGFGAFFYSGNAFVGLVHEQATTETSQQTLFLGNQNGDIVARALVGQAGRVNITTNPNLIPKAINVTGGQWKTIQRVQGESIGVTAAPTYTLSFVTFDFDEHGNWVEQNEELLIAGGQLYTYDGKDIAESGFHLYPQRLTVVGSGTGGSMSDGTYSYKCAYVYYDNSGKKHVSAASPGDSITLSGGVSTQKVTLTLPTLRLTQKSDSNTSVIIEVYRTIASGSIYYQVGAVENDETVDEVSFVDTLADATIEAYPLIYTDGGVLDHIAPPSCSKLLSYRNRILLLSGNDFIYYSKNNTEGDGIAFSDALRVIIDHAGGPIQDIETLDTQIVIAKKEKLLHMYGDPASDQGLGEKWSQSDLSSDVGLKDGCSLSYTSAGILIPSNKGIFLLDRGLVTSYIGAPVEDYNDQTFFPTVALRSSNRVYFQMEDNDSMLVYDTYHGKWSVFTNHSSVDGLEWDNNFVYVNSTGQVYQGDTSYTDDSTSITQKLITSWINVGGIMGYQKLTDIYLFGSFKSSSTLNATIHYDGYSEAISKSIPTDPEPFLIRIRPMRMRCRAFKLEISDSAQTGTEQTFTLNGMKIKVGVKRKTLVATTYTMGQGS